MTQFLVFKNIKPVKKNLSTADLYEIRVFDTKRSMNLIKNVNVSLSFKNSSFLNPSVLKIC